MALAHGAVPSPTGIGPPVRATTRNSLAGTGSRACPETIATRRDLEDRLLWDIGSRRGNVGPVAADAIGRPKVPVASNDNVRRDAPSATGRRN